jgi:hypothetical protein
MIRRDAILAVTLAGLAGCGSSEPASNHAPSPSASIQVQNEGPRRVPFTSELIAQNQLTEADVAQLQFYLHGKVILRREVTAEMREVTKEHTLKMIDGQAYDELLVDGGTPGAVVASTGPEKLRVNFDPDQPDAGFEFEVAPDNRYRIRGEPVPHHDRVRVTTYAGEPFKLVEGAGAFLEINAEDLRALVKRQRKLPGNLLPVDGEPSSTAPATPPAGSALPPPPPPPANQ